jgi:hypothetical protein
MEIVRTGKKGKYLNSSQKFRIYLISKDNVHMNETYGDTTQYSWPYVTSKPDNSTYPPSKYL